MAEQIVKTQEDIDKVKGMLDALPLARKSGKAVAWRINCIQYRENRSTDQNKLYWRWMQYLEDQTGELKEVYHEIFKKAVCPYKKKSVFKETIEVKSTALLSTKEFCEYLEKIHHYVFTQAGIALEWPPDTQYDEYRR